MFCGSLLRLNASLFWSSNRLGICRFANVPVNCPITSRNISVFSTPEPNGTNRAWHKAVSEAEKVVGFPTSFLSLRALLSDEFSGVAIHLRKLIDTKHPLLNTARGIVFDSKNYLQTRGLIVLLISKAAIIQNDVTSPETYDKQRTLAEITELIHIAFLVHRGVLDEKDLFHLDVSKSDVDFGNKLAVLGGDFLLANACTGLGKLHNTEVVDLMSSSIGDMSTALLMLPEDGAICDEISISAVPVKQQQWINMMKLANGSLLANACKSALILSATDEGLVDVAEKFAHHLVLAQQARHDTLRFDSFETLKQKPNYCSLCSLPVVLMSEQYGGLSWLDQFRTEVDNKKFDVNVSKVLKAVKDDPIALERSQDICIEYVDSALHLLNHFPTSEAKHALTNILRSVKQ